MSKKHNPKSIKSLSCWGILEELIKSSYQTPGGYHDGFDAGYFRGLVDGRERGNRSAIKGVFIGEGFVLIMAAILYILTRGM